MLGYQYNTKKIDKTSPIHQSTVEMAKIHAKKIIYELGKIENGFDDDWLKRERKNMLRFENSPVIQNVVYLLSFCTITSIKKQKEPLFDYLLSVFDGWMTKNTATRIYYNFFCKEKLPTVADNITLFASYTEASKKDRGKVKQHPEYVFLRLSEDTNKQDLLKYINENWNRIQQSFSEIRPSSRVKNKGNAFAKYTITQYLMLFEDLKPKDIRFLLEDVFPDEYIDIYEATKDINKERKEDWFREAHKELRALQLEKSINVPKRQFSLDFDEEKLLFHIK